MFILSPDQEYILGLLIKTQFMRTRQVLGLLRKLDSQKNEGYANSMLRQLGHMQKIAWKSEDIFTLPLLYGKAIDADMLAAIDIMLDLNESRILALSANNKPYKLCFFTGQEDSSESYGVITVPPGYEGMVTTSLYGTDPEKRILIFLLSDMAQRNGIKTSLPHFFAIYDNGRYRYFKGGG